MLFSFTSLPYNYLTYPDIVYYSELYCSCFPLALTIWLIIKKIKKSSLHTDTTSEQTTTKTVLVFGRDHHVPLTPAIVEEAWQVIQVGPQGNVTFEYPEDTSVGAYYTREDGSQVNIGPYPAKAGTTWTCQMNTQYDDGNMEIER